MNDPTPNIDALRAVARWLRSPEAPSWDQYLFYQYRSDCGTICCVGGYASTVLGGGVPVNLQTGWDGVQVTGVVEVDGEIMHIEDHARQVLGLTESQANRLFYGVGNDPQQAIAVLSEYAGERL